MYDSQGAWAGRAVAAEEHLMRHFPLLSAPGNLQQLDEVQGHFQPQDPLTPA